VSARNGHLGDLAAALVDGALDGGARDRALVHIAGCTDCRAEVDHQRQLKERLRRRGDPFPPTGLTDRLSAIGRPPAADGSRVVDLAGSRSLPTASAPVSPSMAQPMSPCVAQPMSTPGPRPPAWGTGHGPLGASRPSSAPARAQGSRRSRSRRLRRVTGGMSALALGVAAALVLGPLRGQGPAVSPPVGRYTVEHARTTGGVPGADVSVGAVMTVSVNR